MKKHVDLSKNILYLHIFVSLIYVNICSSLFLTSVLFFLYFTLLTDWALYNTASGIHPTPTPPWLHEHRQVQLPVENCYLLTRWHLECWFHKRGNFSLKCHEMKWQKGRTLSIFVSSFLRIPNTIHKMRLEKWSR